jgi:transposase InsO family protein
MCVQSKQPRKPHKAAEARNLAPLELVHSDLCEMNGELTKGGKRYFMIFIDDCTRFCYMYLLKTKDEALHYFKAYKAEVENQLERKIKWLRSDQGRDYFSSDFLNYAWNMKLFTRGHRHTHYNLMGLLKERTAL